MLYTIHSLQCLKELLTELCNTFQTVLYTSIVRRHFVTEINSYLGDVVIYYSLRFNYFLPIYIIFPSFQSRRSVTWVTDNHKNRVFI